MWLIATIVIICCMCLSFAYLFNFSMSSARIREVLFDDTHDKVSKLHLHFSQRNQMDKDRKWKSENTLVVI